VVGGSGDLRGGGLDAALAAVGVGDRGQLHLRDHDRVVGVGAEAATLAHHAGGVRGGGDTDGSSTAIGRGSRARSPGS